MARERIRRRTFLGTAGAGLALAGCGSLSSSSGGSGKTVKIGFVSPETGTLAAFGESNAYVLGKVRSALAKGLTIGGTTYPVEILTKDSQSSAARAASAAAELIQQDSVDFMIATSAPDTTNPVSNQCEAAGVPCVATICPWEIWFQGRNGSTAKPWTYTYLYFIGTQEEIAAWARLWQRIGTDHVVAGLWPNDQDGDAYRQYVGKEVASLGWRTVDSGAYTDGSQDFSSIIAKFAAADAQIVQAAPIPPDWVTFWRQAKQSRYSPTMACVAKALLFPSAAQSLGSLVENVMAPVWWSAAFPYRSSLDGMTAKAYADGYVTSTGRPWAQPMGFNYAAFEIAVAALKASGDPKDRKAVAAAIGAAKGEAITGHYDFTAGPTKNVSLAPDLIGQWRVSGSGYNLLVVDNSGNTAVPVEATLAPL